MGVSWCGGGEGGAGLREAEEEAGDEEEEAGEEVHGHVVGGLPAAAETERHVAGEVLPVFAEIFGRGGFLPGDAGLGAGAREVPVLRHPDDEVVVRARGDGGAGFVQRGGRIDRGFVAQGVADCAGDGGVAVLYWVDISALLVRVAQWDILHNCGLREAADALLFRFFIVRDFSTLRLQLCTGHGAEEGLGWKTWGVGSRGRRGRTVARGA